MSSVVLVTGGSGFIGSHVVDRLASAGYRPRIFDVRPSPWHDGRIETAIGDVRRPADVQRAVAGCGAICHLAAAADVGEVLTHPAWATDINASGTMNVLEAAREAGVTRVVYASTVWVYSDVNADDVDEETPLRPPAHLYTASKLAGELYCRSYAELYGLEPTILRFGIPYGPRARPAAVIPSFVDRARRGEPLVIAGSGAQERTFVYVEDLADGVVRGLAPAAAGRTYNLAGTETTTVRELAELVREQVADVPIVHVEGRSGDLRGTRVRADRAARELGWEASTPLREGLRRYVEWAASEPAVAPEVPAEEHVTIGRLVGALTAMAQAPTLSGAVALVAVASAALSAILGANEETQAADFTVLAIALLVPLWSLTVVLWPPDRRRLQAAVAALYGAFSVVLLALVSAAPGEGGVHAARMTLVVAVSASLSSALWVLPRKRAPSKG